MKYLLLVLFLISLTVEAGQVSITKNSWMNETDLYRGANDTSLQINWGDEEYWFLGYRQMVPVYYAYKGARYNMLGLGLGKYWSMGQFRPFAQVGLFKVENDFGYQKGANETYDYYLNQKFSIATGHRQKFTGFEVENDEYTISMALGVDMPIREDWGAKIHYEYMRLNEIVWGYKVGQPDRYKVNSWMDTNFRDISNIGIGIYWNF